MNQSMPLPPPNTKPRIIDPAPQTQETAPPPALRPQNLDEFIGQEKECANLRVFIKAAVRRSEPLDHVLLAGPPGLGKTTLAHLIARERKANVRTTSGPALQRPGDLAAILTNLQTNDVIFIDEIHRLSPPAEEILYPALEDYSLDLIIGEGPGAQSVRIALNPFTLIGATTRTGLLTTPLRDRFGITLRLDFYSTENLCDIILASARQLGFKIHPSAAAELAARARGTPRIAQRMLRRVRDFAPDNQEISLPQTRDALNRLRIDEAGLDPLDHRYLSCLVQNFAGLPAGIETLSAALGETRDTLEDSVEPYLIRLGFLQKTPRGRQATPKAAAHLNIKIS